MNDPRYQLIKSLAHLDLQELPSSGSSSVKFNGRVLFEKTGKFEIGLWGCSPGTWVRAVEPLEFCYFQNGAGTYTSEDGTVYEIQADTGFMIQPHSKGTWNVTHDMRKLYAVFYG